MLNENKTQFSGKIAVATNNQKTVTGHIGKCKAFMIYEIEDDKILNKELRENLFTNHRMSHRKHPYGEGGRHGHNHTHLIEGLKDCSYLISKGGGWRVVEDLKEYKIATLFTEVELINDAVDKFIRGELKNDERLVCDHKE
jgi:predicted Fe-Mo cluster-binding NifX family protein